MSADQQHYVYVVAYPKENVWEGPVKVGITKALKGRLQGIQTGSPHPVGFAWAFAVPNRAIARQLEESFHETQKRFALKGEWFDMNPTKAVQLMCMNITAAVRFFMADATAEECQAFLDKSGVTAALEYVDKDNVIRNAMGKEKGSE